MRIAVVVHGTVQGVGFRPFVRRAAMVRGLTGWVRNDRDAVRLEVQGSIEAVTSFRHVLVSELPAPASIASLEDTDLHDRDDETAFAILESTADAEGAALLPADLAWLDTSGATVAQGSRALDVALEILGAGGIVALRGLGGFQLLCAAMDSRAVSALRARKRRPHKPFAVMFRDLQALAEHAAVTSEERELLASSAAPIVLVASRASSTLAPEVAPSSPWIGAMIPYTPLHGLLLDAFGAPIVCTSGNLSNEPICTSTDEAVARLATVADGFLTHDRHVVRPLDDSVSRASRRGPVVLRRARGLVPAPVGRVDTSASVLALGAHSKSTVTLAQAGRLIPSQHLGDLDSLEARVLLERTSAELCAFFDAKPSIVACDLHPDYASTLFAEKLADKLGARLVRVQHHHAHIGACMAEHELDGYVLGLAWDGTGYGLDGTIWGGEALVASEVGFRRVAHLRPFPLPGGDRASRDPRRAALGLLHAVAPDEIEACARPWFGSNLPLHLAALERRAQAPTCTSAGRVFDAIAALLGLCHEITFEGQAAIALENEAARATRDRAYPLPLGGDGTADTAPLVTEVLADLRGDVPASVIARRVHEAFVDLGCAIAERVGLTRVVLSGGCFQNRILADALAERLEHAGFQVFTPAAIPANDGGISVGQAWIASQRGL